ncbi:MAG: ABC transporter permease [Lachnospiraceae bacterium]|nr:ABC transporter permease [Lachnospiraceae bacterium]
MANSKKKEFNLGEFYSRFGIFIIFLIMFILFSILNKNFLSGMNVRNIVRQIVVITIMACGEQLMIICGMIDLSASRVLACTGTLAAYTMLRTHNLLLSLLVAVVVGFLFGCFNGFFIVRFEIPPFIATLASMMVAEGFIMTFTGGQNYSNLGDAFTFIGQGYIGAVPFPVIIMIIILVITYYLLSWTPIGRGMYAVGGNTAAAKASGINVGLVKFTAAAYAGVMSSIAGIVLMSRMNSGQPAAAISYEMDAITAVIIGGTSMSGGTGTIINTIVGSLIIGIIKNFMNLQNINASLQKLVLGLLVLVAVVIDNQVRRSRSRG